MTKNGNAHSTDPQTENHSSLEEASATADEAEQARTTRRPASERPASFNAMAWLVEGASGLVEELRHSDLGLSEEFWVHLYAARRESLLAARAAIDALLAKLDQEAHKHAENEQRRARRGDVKIDF